MIEQIAVGTVNFHAIKAGLHGQFRGMGKLGHDAANLLNAQGLRLATVGRHGLAVRAGNHGLCGCRLDGCPCRGTAIGMQRGMRDAAAMPDLGEHPAICGMYGIGNLFPARSLRFVP